jgi:hypothetical protein
MHCTAIRNSGPGFLPAIMLVVLLTHGPALALHPDGHGGHSGAVHLGEPHHAEPGSYTLESNVQAVQPMPMTPFAYSVRILRGGAPVKAFATLHEEPLHLVVIRKDLQHFMHLHPSLDPKTGGFTLEGMTFPEAGPYRIFADFLPASEADGRHHGLVLYEDVFVGLDGQYEPVPVVEGPMSGMFDGYLISLALSPKEPSPGRETTLSFLIMHEGKPVTDLENYLGSLGHMVVLRQGDLAFQHLHANERREDRPAVITFTPDVPGPGTYKLFTQFQDRGKVITTEFVLVLE